MGSEIGGNMPKILVAEDERDIRELIAFTLRYAGFEVILVSNGQEAIEQASELKPDLILLDVRMPRMTGYDACRELKENPATSEIPIVFLSAKGQEVEIEEGLASGALEYIVKPFAPDELANQVKGILKRVGALD
jgi:two-component system alkaline phosphatase synthesis response regulator PhoP